MHFFYIPNISSGSTILSEEESKHCIRVLRLQRGSEIKVVDGLGNLFTCQIEDPNPKRCALQIVNTQKEFSKRNFHLHIAIAPTKNIERFEWFLEKATEIGIDQITPIICEHSERKVIKPERLEKIIIAAMKQSVKAYKPKLNPLTAFKDVVNNSNERTKLIGYCDQEAKLHAKELITPGQSIIYLIGPEGDFSLNEVELAIKNGFQAIVLGNSRLRTETAGVVACTIANTINGM